MNRDQAQFWNELAQVGADAAVIDPYDIRGAKNAYVVELRNRHIVAELKCYATGSLVLDFGCGSGLLSRYLVAKGFSPVSLDISSRLLEYAVRHPAAGDARYVRYGGGDLPFADRVFDAVATYVVLNHIIDDAEFTHAIREIYRCLKPGGILISIEQIRRRRFLDTAGVKLQRPVAEFRMAFADAGFVLEQVELIRFGHFPTTYLVRYGLLPAATFEMLAGIERGIGRLCQGSDPLLDYADVSFCARRPESDS